MPTRLEAIVISGKDNLSYTEIQKKVKIRPDLKDLDGNMSKTRSEGSAEIVVIVIG